MHQEHSVSIQWPVLPSPLGPVLADIFMAHLEQRASNIITKMSFYKRYVDDIFVVCESAEGIQNAREALNLIHPNIKFTSELESANCLPFLDVLLTRRDDGSIQRSIYRKKTWKGQYIHFKSFAPISHKRGLVRTLFERARKLCSEDVIDKESAKLHEILQQNGYPKRFIAKYSICKSNKQSNYSVAKKDVYITLPYKGDDVTTLIKRRLNSAIKRTYNTANLVFVETTNALPTPQRKDKVPCFATSSCVYLFCCTCGCKYIGRTTRTLCTRVAEHIPRWLQQKRTGVPKSAITKHLADTRHTVDPQNAFSILYRAKSKRSLGFAEAIAIQRLAPNLCIQKEMLVSLNLSCVICPIWFIYFVIIHIFSRLFCFTYIYVFLSLIIY